MKRNTPLRAKPLGADEIDRRDRIVRMVRARDGRCLLGVDRNCFGRLTPHHLRKQSQGGDWSLLNLVMLCEHHNDDIENQPDHYHEQGLVVRHGESIAETWSKMYIAGLVGYLWDGQPV